MNELSQLISSVLPEWVRSFFNGLVLNAGALTAVCITGLLGVICLIWKTRSTWQEWSWVKTLARHITQKTLPRADKRFMVAIAHLGGDDGGVARQNLLAALESLPIEVSGFDRHLKTDDNVAQKE